MRVVDLAAATNVSGDTIRYYERAGLLPPPARTPAGYRCYDASAIDRLNFIQGAQRLGLRLREIAELLAVRDSGDCPCDSANTMIRQRIADIDTELARLTALRAELVAMAGWLSTADTADVTDPADCHDPVPGTWCPPDQACERR
jgi:DNA-binding transcriptional MerR regulator